MRDLWGCFQKQTKSTGLMLYINTTNTCRKFTKSDMYRAGIADVSGYESSNMRLIPEYDHSLVLSEFKRRMLQRISLESSERRIIYEGPNTMSGWELESEVGNSLQEYAVS